MENDKSSIVAQFFVSHKRVVLGIILLVCPQIVVAFFPDLFWALPALLAAGVFALAAPLARLSQNNAWWRQYRLLVGGLGFVALWLYGFILSTPARWPYGHLVVGIIFILLWVFRRKRFVLNLTSNSMDSNQKNTLHVVLAVAVVISLAGVGYFSFTKKSTPSAQPATPPAAQQPEEPFTYTKNDQLFAVTKKEFSVADQFTAPALKDQSQECGTNKTEQYFKDLLSKYTSSDRGIEYNFQYQGPTQDSGIWVVTVIPNKLGYANIDDFNKDFDYCAAGAIYPSLVSEKYLLFVSSCSSGFDDGSGKPHGCDLVREAVEPTIKLQSALTQAPASINIDDLKSLAICGITVKVPSFVNTEINKDNDYAPNGEYDKATGCRYGTSDYSFSVLVWDKNNVAPLGRDLLWQARIKAFDQYQKINDINSIKNFSASDILSTSIANENLYKKINNNSVGYTAEIFQDFPGSGVYQTLTEVDDRYLVYLTYGLFSRADKAWQDYFNKRYSFEQKNQEQIFKEYMSLNLNLAAIVDKLDELNSIAGAVK